MNAEIVKRLPQCPVCDGTILKSAFTVSGTEILRLKNYILTDEERAWLVSLNFPILRCTGCDFYFHELVPSSNLSDILYNRWIHSDGSLAKVRDNPFGYLYFLSYFMEIYSYYKKANLSMHGNSLLEVGCGWGKFMEMARLFGLQSYGVEYTREKLAYVREKGMVAYLPEELPSDATFDVIAMLQVLEHLSNPYEFLLQYTCRVKPGGLIILEVPNCNYLVLRRMFYRVIGRDIFGAYQPLEHVNCFTSRSMDKLMARLGFSNLKGSTSCVKTRLGTFSFKRSIVEKFPEILLGSTGRIYVRNDD